MATIYGEADEAKAERVIATATLDLSLSTKQNIFTVPTARRFT
jgi:hypothetical protein